MRASRFPLRPGQHQGFTLAEVLVCVGILGALAAVLVPAVQHVRESSRRLTCEQNLHQVGVAISNFEGRNGFAQTVFDPWHALMPDLELRELAEQWTSGTLQPGDLGLDVLCCPTDSWANAGWGLCSFWMNAGAGYTPAHPDGFIAIEKSGDQHGRRMWRDITDGTSTTVMVSERLVDRLPGTHIIPLDAAGSDPSRFLHFTPHVVSPIGDGRAFGELCRSQGTLPAVMVQPHVENGYDHMQPPNRWGCLNGPESGYYTAERSATAPASSRHPAGINALACDSAVRFVAETVDAEVWRAVGTISGSEAGRNAW